MLSCALYALDMGDLTFAYVATRVVYLIVVLGLIIAMYRFLHR
ncbi:MAG TPA: hypothetical protein VH496_14185 [Mycobacterium sp.]